jgi:predicted ATPase
VYEEVRRYFTLFARSIVDLKGKKQAVQPYEVISERQTPFADLPPFVGREDEWQFLQSALRRASDECTLQTVLVRGPAGVGKSRLVWELRDWAQKQDEVYWVDLVQYDTSERLPSHGLNALLRGRFGLTVDMDEEHTLALLYERVLQEGLFADPESARRAAGYFAFILGLHASDSALHQLGDKLRWEETFLVVKDWLERRAAEGVTVWFIEDIQKGDADTAAFFDWALQMHWHTPALVIMTAREEDFDSHSLWHAPLERWLQQERLVELHLREISPPVIAQAIETMAGGHIPPALALRIAEHTEGNPLFATEIVLLLKERGILEDAQVDWQQLARPA